MNPYYQDESVTIYHGDAREVLPVLSPVDAVMTDPWYYSENSNTRNAFEDDAFWRTTRTWLSLCSGLTKESGGHMFICFSPQKMAKFEYLLCELSLPLQSRLIWHYRNAGGRCADTHRFGKTYEMVYHIGFGSKLNFPAQWGDERFDVWTIAMPQSNFNDRKIHPFQKPIELARRLVTVGSVEGQIVLDPFAGSGTFGVACKEMGRKFIGIEIEERHCESAANRMAQVLSLPSTVGEK